MVRAPSAKYAFVTVSQHCFDVELAEVSSDERCIQNSNEFNFINPGMCAFISVIHYSEPVEQVFTDQTGEVGRHRAAVSGMALPAIGWILSRQADLKQSKDSPQSRSGFEHRLPSTRMHTPFSQRSPSWHTFRAHSEEDVLV